jgi:hypothetical protein
MKKLLLLTYIAIVFLVSCVTVPISEEFPTSSSVDLSQAYFFGKFIKPDEFPISSLTICIKNEETGKEFMIRFIGRDQPLVFQITPGRYRITRFLSYDILKSRLGQIKFPESIKGLNSTFTVEPGMLLYIGDYRGRVVNVSNGVRTSINSIEDNFSSTLEKLMINNNDLNVLTVKNLFIN